MANLVFYMDYGPLISRVHKSAFLVYMYYEKFQNDAGIVQFTYHELNDHLGLATSTIQKSNALLKKMQLIEEVESSQGKKYKLLPVKKITQKMKQAILSATKTEDYLEDTVLKRKYLEDEIPAEYQQLLNKKNLKSAYKAIGSLRGVEVCKHFKIDYYTFRLLCERDGPDSFKSKFRTLSKQIEGETQKKKPRGITKEEKDLATYLYDILKSLDAPPIGKNWFMKNCNTAKGILGDITSEEAKRALDWGFKDSWWSTKITDLSSVPNLYQRSRLQSKKGSKNLARSTPIPASIREQIAQEVLCDIQVETYEDAAFLKQSILDGQENKDIKKIVTILEKGGIIPSGEENLRFG